MIYLHDDEILKRISACTTDFWDIVYDPDEEKQRRELIVWGTQIATILEMWEDEQAKKKVCEKDQCACDSSLTPEKPVLK